MPDSSPVSPMLPNKDHFTEELCQKIEGFQRIQQISDNTLATVLKLSSEELHLRKIRVKDFSGYEIAVCSAVFRTTVSYLVGEEYSRDFPAESQD